MNEPLIGNPPSHPRKERGLSAPSPAYQPPISSIREESLGREGVGVCAVGGVNPPALPHTHHPVQMLAGVVLGPQASLSPGGALKPGTADGTFRELGRERRSQCTNKVAPGAGCVIPDQSLGLSGLHSPWLQEVR